MRKDTFLNLKICQRSKSGDIFPESRACTDAQMHVYTTRSKILNFQRYNMPGLH